MKETFVPHTIDDVMLAFPANVTELMPDNIPDEYRSSEAQSLAIHWFYSGLKNPAFYPREGIDAETAFRHVRAILGSFQPKHEDKMTAVAYLLDLWFEKITYE